MFLNDSDFDKATRPTSSNYSSRPSTSSGVGLNISSQGRYGTGKSTIDNNTPSMVQLTLHEDDDNTASFANIGSLNSSGSRARMLAQQREIQLKKRQSSAQTGGMIISTTEKSPSTAGSGLDGQFTPAVRQFSMPKKSLTSDESPSEFGNSNNGTRRVNNNKYDMDDIDQNPRQVRNDRNRRYEDDGDDDNVDSGYNRRGLRDKNSDRSNERYDDRHHNRDYDEEERQFNSGGRNTTVREQDFDSNINNNQYNNMSGNNTDNYDSQQRQQVNRNNSNAVRGGLGGRGRGPGLSQHTGTRLNDSRNSWDRDQPYRRDSGADANAFRSNDHDARRTDYQNSHQKEDASHGGDYDDNHARWNSNTGNPSTGAASGGYDAVPRGPGVPAAFNTGLATNGIVPLNLSNMKAFLCFPLPRSAGIVQCYIRRVKSTLSLVPTYNLYLKDGDRFLLTSRKRPNNKTSNYLISMTEGDLNRDSPSYLGKVRSNFMGTEFQIYDNGTSPKDVDTAASNSSDSLRKDLGAVTYAANILGARGPRKMQVAIPSVDENDRITTWRTGFKNSTQDDILQRIKDRHFRDLIYLINKPPRWNEQVGAYVLNFNGRVTMASVKNFQLVDPDDLNTIVLQFGRVAKDEFSMDMQWPISPLQAFAITMSSFDSKIACD